MYDFVLNKQNIICDYDPCIYQGVLIKFYWNDDKRCKMVNVYVMFLVMEKVKEEEMVNVRR